MTVVVSDRGHRRSASEIAPFTGAEISEVECLRELDVDAVEDLDADDLGRLAEREVERSADRA